MENKLQEIDQNGDDVSHNHTIVSTPTSSTSGCVSGDDSDGKTTVPPSLIGAGNYLEESSSLNSVDDLAKAVEQCREMVLESSERSEERKWLVRRLIELRLRLQEAKEALNEDVNVENTDIRVVLGHHFIHQNQPITTSKLFCDRCCGVIWSMIQSWYKCRDCQFLCHIKCLSQVCRVCAHVRVSENPDYITDICPEVGLSAQAYSCAECKSHITFKNSWIEPRLCDYDGCYYCPSCHWNSLAIIPSRVIHNWDFEERRVCRASRQVLRLMIRHPVINLQALNPKLFRFVEELSFIKKMREDIMSMKKYFISCKDAADQKLLFTLKDYHHFTENANMYSMQDLIDINAGKLSDFLMDVHTKFTKHIKEDCKLCYGRGYVCEMCEDNEVIFPFDSASAGCEMCYTVFHKNCWNKRNQQCPKCMRLLKREKQRNSKVEEEEEELNSL